MGEVEYRSTKWLEIPLIGDTAKKAQASEYRRVSENSLESVAIAIRDNKGCLIGFSGANNGTWLTEYPQTDSSPEWGHAMYAGKAQTIKGKKYIGCLNSWGEKTGKKGWQWFGEEWFEQKLVLNPWTIMDKPTKFFLRVIDKKGQQRKIRPNFISLLAKLLNEGYRVDKVDSDV